MSRPDAVLAAVLRSERLHSWVRTWPRGLPVAGRRTGVADRWHVGLVDLTGGAGLLGQVPGRAAASVSAWIDAQSAA